MLRQTPIFIALTSIFAAGAVAQAQEQVQPLESITVTASRSHADIASMAATVWVVDQQHITAEMATGADLKQILGRIIPGLDVGSESRTNFAQNLRGRTALVMLDGVSLNSTRQISRQLDSIDPFNIARVEVISGATSIYGAGAAGGIINIISKRAEATDTQLSALLSVTSGFNESDDLTHRAAVAIAAGNEQIRGRLALAMHSTGGAYNADGDLVLPDITQTDTQFNDTLDVHGSLTVQVAEQQSLALAAQHYNSEQDTEYGAYLGPNLAGILGFPEFIQLSDGLQLAEQPATDRSLINVQYHHQNTLGHDLLAQAFYRQESLQFFPFPAIFQVQGAPFPGDLYPIFGASEQDTAIAGIKLVAVKESDATRFTYGIDVESESFEAQQRVFDLTTALASGGLQYDLLQTLPRYPDIDSDRQAVFAQGEWQIAPAWRLSAGARWQRVAQDISEFTPVLQQHLASIGAYPLAPTAIPGGSSNYHDWLLNLGAVYRIDANEQLWASFNQGFSTPDPARYYGRGNYVGTYGEGPILLDSINVADNPLSAIKTDSIELGWRKVADHYQVQLSGYYSVSDRTISYDSATLAIEVNDDERRIMGIEGQLTYEFNDNLYASVQGHLLDSNLKQMGAWIASPVEEASPDSLAFRLGYRQQQLGAELHYSTVLDYEDEVGNTIDGYATVNLSSYYQLPQGKLTLGVSNLLNRDYQTIWSQRAQILYRTLSAPELFTYQGQGTRVTLSYALDF